MNESLSQQPEPSEALKYDPRKEYLSFLTRIAEEGIENPTEADLMRITPHLTPEQRIEAFTPEDGKGSVYVACPPTLVRRGYNMVTYIPEPTIAPDGTVYPPRLRYAYANRTIESYADRMKHGDVFFDMPYQEEAMKYSEEHWGDQLVVDDWDYFTTMYVQDPTDLNPSDAGWPSAGGPKTKAVVYYTSNRDGSEMANDYSKPHSEIVENAMAIATTNLVEGSEIKGGRGGWTEFMCAHCAGGLDLSSCTNCGNEFRDDHMRSGHSEPMSPTVVKLLEDEGHEFTMNPNIAYERERQNWEKAAEAWDQRNI